MKKKVQLVKRYRVDPPWLTDLNGHEIADLEKYWFGLQDFLCRENLPYNDGSIRRLKMEAARAFALRKKIRFKIIDQRRHLIKELRTGDEVFLQLCRKPRENKRKYKSQMKK
ncbi:uncharacterized protein LOC135693712 isoform X2 [Rhopilema esculentum]|uniref:uncharacterized protein LOC135693712 isoform X2 n=1 Tax=Rhopilema esculentum TaxID=499914 RepID=UPI0031CF8578